MIRTKDNAVIGQIQKRWDALIPNCPELQQVAEFHRMACSCVFRQPPQLKPFPLQPSELREKLEQGVALLQGEEAHLDFTQVSPLFYELVKLALTYKETSDGEFRKSSDTLDTASSSRPSLLKKVMTGAKSVFSKTEVSHERKSKEKVEEVQRLFIHALRGEMDPLLEEARQHNLSLEGFLTLLYYSLTPTLQTYAIQLKPFLDLDLWTQGYCPVCGAWPSLSELRGSDPIRYLRCSLCGSDWMYPLLHCPYCKNTDHKRLGYFFIEGNEKKDRIYVCEECKGYLKVFSVLDPIQPELLSLEDLATLQFDIVASDKGYNRPYPFQKRII